MTPRLAPEQRQAPQVKPWHRHVISPLRKPASLPTSAPPDLVYSALQGWQKYGGIDGRRETRARVGEAIDGAAVTTTGCALWLGARQLRSVVSLMNYPIIWANSGDGSRQSNSETGNGRKYRFISIRHLAHLTGNSFCGKGSNWGNANTGAPSLLWLLGKVNVCPSPGRIHLSIY